MKKTFILWLLLGVCCTIQSQVVTIIDKETALPLELATLISEKPHAFATTNAQGQANISAFSGSEKIEVRMLGYKTVAINFAEIEKGSFVITLSQIGVSLDHIVISASRWSQLSRDVPARIISISTKDVALENPQTTADMLGNSGEVFIQKSQQGGGSPMIRGFATNRLLYSVDGVRMNTAIFRAGNIQNIISLDPFAIEKTEVFFGPGSVIYGSDAIGGVMSFQTLTPQFSMTDKSFITGKAVMRYASANNEKTAHFDVNVGWKKWAMVSSISSNDFDDLRMGSNGPRSYLRPFYVQRQDSVDVVVTNDDPRIQRPSGYSQINMMQKLSYRPNEKWEVQYGFHYSVTSDYSRYDRHIRYKKGLPRYGEWYYGPQEWMMNNLSITHNGNNVAYDQLTVRIAQQYFQESRISRDINKPNRETRIEEVDAYSVNVDFNKAIGAKHKLFYGLEGVQNQVASNGIDEDISTGIKQAGAARYPQSDWASYAAYLNYQLKLSEKMLIQIGARYNQYSLEADFDTTFYPFPYTTASMNNAAITGSAGLVYRPTEKWVVSLNGSTGFRAPNVDDAGKVFDSAPGLVVVPNPDLEAEYAINGEAGIAKLFGEVVKVDLTGYYTILQNAMVRRDYTMNGLDSIAYDGEMSRIQSVQNAAVATVYGVQAGVDVKLRSGFGFSSNFNYQVGEEELDDGSTSPSRHAPPMYGVSRLTYSTQRLRIEFYAVYSGEKKFDDLPEEEKAKTEIYAVDADGNPCSPGWYTLNFKAIYKLEEKISVSAGLENLTDQRYRPYSSGLVAPGRNFLISLRVGF
ncbi:MAG: TonB-dependent receptor [Bacteroidetes bacterium]|nr:TonB-dependent receptor [Bacteroidota bacterium]MBU1718541.1 TonB-dependent receptor [Bacteroidota bacterium]